MKFHLRELKIIKYLINLTRKLKHDYRENDNIGGYI